MKKDKNSEVSWEKNFDKLYCIRHSAAHLLAQAVVELFPGTKPTIGPVTENGFFYDFLPIENFHEEDLGRIEQKMHELSEMNLPIIRHDLSKEEALKKFKNNEFKIELIKQLPGEMISVYCQGDFCDLCKGGHVSFTGQVKFFKLTSIAGAYWRGRRDNVALQRIYGIAFESQAELDKYLQHLEEVKLNDHRRLGKQLDLFSFNEVAVGFPFFHNNGLIIFNKLIDFMRLMQKGDYQEVKTPIIMQEKLWKISGHYDHYKENMYFTYIDDQPYCIKPMNCPGGILLYKERPHSYRELPLRVSEFGLVHRHELSGVLHGLFRVRAFTQDDAHVYCMPTQIEEEVVKILDLAEKIYKRFDFEKIRMVLSTRPENSMGDTILWEKATEALRSALINKKLEFGIDEGGGAFYGPKIDMLIEDTMGREWQCGTVQVDFFLPQNFELEYIDSDQSRKRPVLIHRAIYGSLERFMGILIEHYKGRFPFWLAPVQIKLLTITDQQLGYAEDLAQKLRKLDFRVEIDYSSDQISGKIRKAQQSKVPWMLILGKKEAESQTITLRFPDGKQQFGLSIASLIEMANKENALLP